MILSSRDASACILLRNTGYYASIVHYVGEAVGASQRGELGHRAVLVHKRKTGSAGEGKPHRVEAAKVFVVRNVSLRCTYGRAAFVGAKRPTIRPSESRRADIGALVLALGPEDSVHFAVTIGRPAGYEAVIGDESRPGGRRPADGAEVSDGVARLCGCNRGEQATGSDQGEDRFHFFNPSTQVGAESAKKLSLRRGGIIQPIGDARPAQPDGTDVDDVSTLLRAWSGGDRSALERLTPIVYAELHRLARRYMKRERAGHSLQTTALVNEAYMRLVDYKRMQWQNRAHFFAVSAQLMRRILVENARRHNVKRGAGMRARILGRGGSGRRRSGHGLSGLDDAMNALARLDARKVQVVEMRFFGGLSVEETAEVFKVSAVTVMRDWSSAKAWLYRELAGGTGDGFGSMETSR